MLDGKMKKCRGYDSSYGLMRLCLFVVFFCGFYFTSAFAREVVSDVIAKARAIESSVDIRSGGVIVVPDEKGYMDLAAEIQNAINDSLKTEYSIVHNIPNDLSKTDLVIAIGNMMNNPVIERLYWNFYTFATPIYPKKGYVIETVFHPLPIFPNNNAIIIGASGVEDAGNGVASFIEKIKNPEKIIKRAFLEVSVPVNMQDETSYYLKTGGLRGFRGMAEIFHLTGERKYLDDAMKILDEHTLKALDNPDWIVSWGDEIDSFKAVQNWDFIQEFADIDADKTLRYERFFLNLINKLSDRAEIYGQIKPGPVLAWNHTTIPLLGMYTSARYYKAHYGLEGMNYVMEQVDTYLDGQKTIGRVSCDSVNYLLFSLNFCLAYYNMTGKMDFYENGSAKNVTDLIFTQVDNTGFVGGAGDITPYFDLRSEKPWFYLEWKLQMPQMYWFRQQSGAKAEELKSVYFPGTKPIRPDYLGGCVAAKLDRAMYDHIVNKGAFRMPDQAQIPKLAPTCAYNKTFDKLQFRSFTEAGGEYLLVDGLGSGNHGHRDTAAIICGTFEGCRFLDDSDKLIDKSDEHSMITVIKDGQAQLPVPPLAELKHRLDFDGGVYTCVGVPQYNGADWDRHILWLKDKYFVVIDTLKAIEDGNFRTNCVWKLIDRGNETYDGYNLVCTGPHLKIDRIKDIPQKTFNLKGTDSGWLTRRIDATADFPTMKVNQVKNADMKSGDMISYQNLFYLERGEKSYKPKRISATQMLVESDGNNSLVCIGKRKDDIEYDSEFLKIDALNIVSSGLSILKIDGKVLISSTMPIDLEIIDGVAKINAVKDGEIKILLADGEFAADYKQGTSEITLRGGELSGIVSSYINSLTDEPKAMEKDVACAAVEPLWVVSGGLRDRRERDMCAADFAGGNKFIVTASGKELKCVSLDGQTVWAYQHNSNLLSCGVIPVSPDGISIVAGTDEGSILGFNDKGTLVKTVSVNLKGSAKHGPKGRPWVTHIVGRDFGNDGNTEIIAGLRSWNMYIYNNKFEQVWSNSMVLHGVSDIRFGSDSSNANLVYVGDKYGNSHLFDITSDTNRDISNKRNKSHIGDVSLAVIDVNNDGIDDIINASSGGRMAAFDGKTYLPGNEIADVEAENGLLWQYCNYGAGFSCLGHIDSGEEYILAGSASGYLTFINPADGKPVLACDLLNPISYVAAIGDKIIAAGERGDVFEVSSSGKILSRGKAPAGVIKLVYVDGAIVALDVKGNLSFFKF